MYSFGEAKMHMKILVAAAVMAVAYAVPADAQTLREHQMRTARLQEHSPGPVYDLRFETRITGDVTEVAARYPISREPGTTILLIQTREGVLPVFLAPAPYLDERRAAFRPGDRVTITGSRATRDGRPVLLARHIQVNRQMVALRDHQGIPRWPHLDTPSEMVARFGAADRLVARDYRGLPIDRFGAATPAPDYTITPDHQRAVAPGHPDHRIMPDRTATPDHQRTVAPGHPDHRIMPDQAMTPGQMAGWGRADTFQRLYDPSQARNYTGTVERFEVVSPMQGMGHGIALILRTNGEVIPVHLGPSWFMLAQEAQFQPGDRVTVTGVQTTIDGRTGIIAGEVRGEQLTLRLRDQQGLPFWSAYHSTIGLSPGPTRELGPERDLR
jgi:hypothetical protein